MSAKPDISVPAASSDAPLRPISFGDPAVSIDRRDDGTIYLRPKIALGEYPLRLTDRLHHWAKAEPNRIFMAERAAGGLWRQISYAQLLAFGALYAGIPFCPVSPAYSLISRDYSKLGFAMKLLTPGLVFADDATKFAEALSTNVPE